MEGRIIRSAAHENAYNFAVRFQRDVPANMTGPLICFDRWGEIPSEDPIALPLLDGPQVSSIVLNTDSIW